MNNKFLKVLFSSCLLVVLALVLSACGESKFDKYASLLRESSKQAQVIDALAEFKDGDVVVYKYNKHLEMVNEKEAEVTTTVSELNQNFELADSTSIDRVEVNRDTMLLIIMKETLFENVKIENDVLTGTVNKNNIKEVFNNKDLVIKDNASFTFTFSLKQIKTITCTYQTETGKNVNISMSYTY